MRKHSIGKVAILALSLAFSAVFSLQAQNEITVTGTVLDEQSQPMIGAGVVQKGTTNGITTDVDGTFVLTVPRGATIEITNLGYLTEEIVVQTAAPINVQMKVDNLMIEETVVVGYGVQKKSSVTGAIASVKPEDMENRAVLDVASSLQGKTAGVQIITTSGQPGASGTIRVRGYSSNSASDPLYVVDGVRVSSIDTIDPNDIQSIEVLKDAASAAIYGAEAGNGVILVTTKRGTSGNGRVTYDFQYSISSIGKIPEVMSAAEYAEYMVDGGYITQAAIDANWDGVSQTDWIGATFEKGIMQRHTVSFSNGNEQSNIYASLSYASNDGIVKGDKDIFNRLTGTVNAEYRIKPWLKIGTNNLFAKYAMRTVASGSEYQSVINATLSLDPLTKVTYSADELPSHMQHALDQGYTLIQDENGDYYGVSPFNNSEIFNPLITREYASNQRDAFNVTGAAFVEVNPWKPLIFTSRLGYRLQASDYSSYEEPFYGNATQNRNYVSYSATSTNTLYYQWENFANYNQDFGQHSVSGMIGMSYSRRRYNYTTGSLTPNGDHAVSKVDPLFYYLNYASATATRGVAGETTETAKLSYFGRAGYEYANKYMVQFTFRADAADLAYLSKSNRWGYFPAVSAGWTISEEEFFQPVKSVVNNLKFRASWGQNGSLASLGSYQYSTDMASGTVYPLVPGLNYTVSAAPTTTGNENLKWETSEQLNFGIDARFLNDRITLSLDWFDKTTKDLLVNGATPSLSVGGTTAAINAGNVMNRGIEIDASYRGSFGDFNYNIRGNLATLKNEVTYLDPSLSRIGGTMLHSSYTLTYFEQGYPVYYFRGYEYTGVDSETGEPTFTDVNGDGTIGADDLMYIGDGIADMTYGITLSASWKGFDFVIFGSGSEGNDIFNYLVRADTPYNNRLRDIFYVDRWTTTNTDATRPKAGATNIDKYIQSSAMVFDGSYFKIKQIQLGYSIPRTLLKKVGLSSVRAYVSLDDYFTFTKYIGFDPEASTSTTSGMGVDKGGYPTPKKLVFGVNVSF